MSRTGSPARYLLVCAALVGLTVSPTYTAPMAPLDNAAGVVCDPSTGHCYQYFQRTVDWHTAKAAAKVSTHNGVSGHLVTITSAAESAFIVANVSDAIRNNAWIGAYHFGHDNLRDGWEWVTGEPWDYTNWASVAPNEWSERAGLFWHGNGTWNDGHETANWPGGYLVEYPAPAPLGSDLVIGKAGEFGHKGNMAMLFGDGSGGFTMDKVELNEWGQGHEVAVGDLNGDRQDDVVVVYSKGQTWVALGGFSNGLQNSDLVFAGAFPDANDRTRVLQLFDVSGDGTLDIVVTMWAHMAVMLGNGDGTFGAATLSPALAFDARGMALGDLDNDGKADLVAAHASGIWQLVFYRGNGNGTFQRGTSIPGSLDAIPNIFLRDADGDGDLDIYSGGLGVRAKLFINTGAASFTKTDLDPGTGMQGTLLVVDDLNGDGTPDAVAGTEANGFTNVRVWLSNGNGGLVPSDYGPVGSLPRHGVVADINEDGIKDIAMVTTNIFGGNPGSLWTMRGNGDGTFQAPTQPIATYRNNYTIAAGNFDSPTAPTDTTPPVISPTVTGTQSGDWYTSNVTVSWSVSDSESAFTTSGCDAQTLTTDTNGTTFTCSATSAGGTSSESVTIKRDTAGPVIASATANPSVLWSPNNKMVAVTVSVAASDAGSGLATCTIMSVTSNEGVSVHEPDVELTGALTMNLRAERHGNGSGRIYAASISCTDMAGSTSTATATVTVPHDRGKR